jgi:hypothetical protein
LGQLAGNRASAAVAEGVEWRLATVVGFVVAIAEAGVAGGQLAAPRGAAGPGVGELTRALALAAADAAGASVAPRVGGAAGGAARRRAAAVRAAAARAARRSIECLVALQARAGGDALIGRRLFPLLTASGLADVAVSPRLVYVDASRPEWVEGFTRNTFTAMVEGVREQALAAGLVDEETWRRGIAGLRRAAEPDGVFCYTFFKGVGVRRR